MFQRIWNVMILMLVLLAFGVPSWAQLASLTGIVRDSSGAVVPTATVQITNTATGAIRTFSTGSNGSYYFPSLEPAEYTLTVSKTGFQSVTITGVELQVAQSARRDINLQPASTKQQITVSGAPPTLQTETASVGQVVGSRQVVDLPLNGREFKQLALLLPGSVPATLQNQDGTSFNIPSSQFISDGLSGLTYSYRIDGVENLDKLLEINLLDVSVDAIREFKIEQNNFSVDSGRGTTDVSVVTKSGSNALHGDAFEFLRNDALDARNFFDREQSGGKGSFKQNQFGGDLGGRIIRDKLFFFGNFEARRSLQGLTQFANFPTPQQFSGDLSSFSQPILDADRLGTSVCPTGKESGCFFPNNQIPQFRFSQFAKAGMPFFPVPNAPNILPGINDIAVLSQKDNFTQETFRLDFQHGEKDSFMARETTNSSRFNRPNILPYAELNTTYHTSNVAGRWIRTVSSRTVNEFLFGYNYNNYRLEVPTTNTDFSSQFGLNDYRLKAGRFSAD